MNPQSAELLLCSITGVGAIIWLVGLQFLIRSFPRASATRETAQRFGEEPPPVDWICDDVEISGQPADLIPKAVAALASGDVPGVGPVKIVDCRDDRIVFEGAVGDPRRGQFPHIRHAQLRFTPRGPDRTSVLCAAQIADAKWLLWLGMALQGLGFVALLVGFCLVRAYVVSNPDSAVRWQTFQMLQAGHFLWPPFLLAGLYRHGRRTLHGGLDLLLHNLPYRNA